MTIEESFIERFGEIRKRESSYQIIFNCPKCNSDNLSCNLEKGLGKCWKCGFTCSVKGTFTVVSTPVDRPLQLKVVQYLSRTLTLEENHRGYLYQRGILKPGDFLISSVPFEIKYVLNKEFSDKELEAAGLLWVKGDYKKLTNTLTPRRIFIPYWYNGEIVGCKSRANPLDPEDEPKYAIPRGSPVGNHLFYKSIDNRDLLVTEGEFKCITAVENRFNCTASSGINLSRQAANQLKVLVRALGIRRTFIVSDNDEGFLQKPHLIKAALSTSSLVPDSCIVLLPKYNETKQDLDSYFSNHRAKDLDEVLEDSWIRRRKTREILQAACLIKRS